MWLFLARELTFIEADPDGTETIRPVKLASAKAVRQVQGGGITHAPICVLILKAHWGSPTRP